MFSNIKKWIPALILVTIFAACKQASTPKDTVAVKHDSGHHMQHDTMNIIAPVLLKDDRLNAVYDQYQQLTSALIHDDLKNAKIAANAIIAGMNNVAGGEGIRKAAIAITEAKDIESLRVAYGSLNTAFISKVKQTGLSSGALYVDFCPMALNDKGAYWLSAEKEIRNPYMGAQMLTCGEVKDSVR